MLDQVLPEPPPAERTSWGPVPDLVPVVRALTRSTSYLLAQVDSAGADVQAVSARGDELEAATVVGDHDVLHKVPGGGWSHRRFQMRVEDSVQQNAAEVAEQLAAEVRRHQPELVLVAGTPTPVSAVVDHCAPAVTERLVRLRSGGRAAGTDDDALAEEVARVLDERCRERDDEVLERFERGHAVQREGVSGTEAVVAALRRDQVDELLLADRDLPGTLWVSGSPDQLATVEDDLVTIGAGTGRAGARRRGAGVGGGRHRSRRHARARRPRPGPRGRRGRRAALGRRVHRARPRARPMPGHGEGPGEGSGDES